VKHLRRIFQLTKRDQRIIIVIIIILLVFKVALRYRETRAHITAPTPTRANTSTPEEHGFVSSESP
jgi:hypothetical protein